MNFLRRFFGKIFNKKEIINNNNNNNNNKVAVGNQPEQSQDQDNIDWGIDLKNAIVSQKDLILPEFNNCNSEF